MPVLILFTLSSCDKSNDSGYQPAPEDDFMALKVGNYWIYQNYDIDSNGVATPTNDWDSAYISKDTVINGQTYFKMIRKPVVFMSGQFPVYLRDSSGYLVDSDGQIHMSATNFTDTLYTDTTTTPILYYGYLRMFAKDSLITVPAGTFTTRTARFSVVPVNPNDPHPVRYTYDVYARNVGRIKYHSFFYSGDKHFEARLERYHLEP